MFRGIAVAVSVLLVGAGVAPAVAAAHPQSEPPTHVASTFDLLQRGILHVQDRSAVTAHVSAATESVPTTNTMCDEYTTTYTITWTARHAHILTSVVENFDDYSTSFTSLGTTTFTMTPGATLLIEQAPTISRWFVKGTHHRDPGVCPRDTRSVNHVEIRVDGKQRHREPTAVVRPPAERHLAAVWSWPTDVDVFGPARVAVVLNVFRQTDPGDVCYSVTTEIDVNVTALDSNRIITIGERSPGHDTVYQRGDSDSFGRGVVGQRYFLNGTHEKSSRCPADTLSLNRIVIYTEATSSHHRDD